MFDDDVELVEKNYLKKLEEIAEKFTWISVKNRLPEKHGWYLTAHKRIYPTDAGIKICFFYHGYFTTDMEITHWMPLPTPSKGE